MEIIRRPSIAATWHAHFGTVAHVGAIMPGKRIRDGRRLHNNALHAGKSQRRRLKKMSLLSLLVGAAGPFAVQAHAQGAPFGPWASFPDGEYMCEPLAMDNQGTLSKPSGPYPTGTRVVVYRAECSINGASVEYRTYIAYMDAQSTWTPIHFDRVEGAGEGTDNLSANTDHLLYAADFGRDPYVVGTYESDADSNNPFHAFRYDLTTRKLLDLGTFPSARSFDSSAAMGVNMDGTVVVGASDLLVNGSRQTHAFRWTQGLGLTDLTPSGYGGFNGASVAYDTDDAGNVVVGQIQVSASGFRAFRWTLTDAATGAGTMTDLGPDSYNATAVSGDGSVVGGVMRAYETVNGVASDFLHAMRWTQAGGATDLGVLPGRTRSLVTAMSLNGAILVGFSDTGAGGFLSYPRRYDDNVSGDALAFRWTAATGMKDLNALLAAAGVDMAGVVLRTAKSISEDGQYIGGEAKFPNVDGLSPYVIRYVDATNGVATPSGAAFNLETALTGGNSPTNPTNPTTPTDPTSPVNPEPPIAGITTLASVQSSVDRLARARRGIAAQHHAVAAVLLGENERIVAPNQAGPYATGGSVGVGGTARINLREGLSFLGGLSYGTQGYRSSRLSDVFLIAGRLRYLQHLSQGWHALLEAGGFWSPSGDYRFDRTYANGAGFVGGRGSTDGEQTYVFGRAGLVANFGRKDEVALSGEIGRQSIRTNAYAEQDSAANPFPALINRTVDHATIAKIRLQWSHALADRIDATLWGAGARAFTVGGSLTATVLGIGTVDAAKQRYTWAEYGGRISYRLTEKLSLGVLANGTSGDSATGTRVHVGGDIRLLF